MVHQPYDDFQGDIEPDEDGASSNRPGILATLLILLMIASMLGTLFWPLIWQTVVHYSAPPTPTPLFLQEASVERFGRGWHMDCTDGV